MTAEKPIITESIIEFRDALPQAGRLLGVDLGTKRIGLALCDAGWAFATAAPMIERRKFSVDRAQLWSLVAAQSVRGIVIGLPRNMNGSEGPRAQATRAFAKNIANLACPILLWDERWSTQAVERAMIAADISRAKRADRIDSAAAAFILQGAIDALAGSIKAV
jgi:putative holliday junction resolvase